MAASANTPSPVSSDSRLSGNSSVSPNRLAMKSSRSKYAAINSHVHSGRLFTNFSTGNQKKESLLLPTGLSKPSTAPPLTNASTKSKKPLLAATSERVMRPANLLFHDSDEPTYGDNNSAVLSGRTFWVKVSNHNTWLTVPSSSLSSQRLTIPRPSNKSNQPVEPWMAAHTWPSKSVPRRGSTMSHSSSVGLSNVPTRDNTLVLICGRISLFVSTASRLREQSWVDMSRRCNSTCLTWERINRLCLCSSMYETKSKSGEDIIRRAKM